MRQWFYWFAGEFLEAIIQLLVLLVHQLACYLKLILKLPNFFCLLVDDKFHLFAQMSLQFEFLVCILLFNLFSADCMLCDALLHRFLSFCNSCLHIVNFILSRLYFVFKTCYLSFHLCNLTFKVLYFLSQVILNPGLILHFLCMLLFHPLFIFLIELLSACHLLIMLHI